MHLFIFDYYDTLTSLEDPLAFIQALRQRHPGSKIILHTGADPSMVDREHPGLRGLLDDYWLKPCFLPEMLSEVSYSMMTLVDNDARQRRAMSRTLRDLPAGTWRVLDEGGLLGLLTE